MKPDFSWANAHLAWLRTGRTASAEDVRRLVASLDLTNARDVAEFLGGEHVQAWTASPGGWVPRLVGRRLTDATLGAILSGPDAVAWSDRFVLQLLQGRRDMAPDDRGAPVTRLFQAISLTHPVAVARLGVALARDDPWSFLWHLPEFQAAGLEDAIRAGLPILLQHPEQDVRERALLGLGDGAAPIVAAVSPVVPVEAHRPSAPRPVAARRP